LVIEREYKMTTRELQRYKNALSIKIAELYETLGNRRPIAIEYTPEVCEQIVQAAQREIAVVTLDRHSRLLREVKAAVVRIENGSYGVCESCEESITSRRLNAVPWARYCVQCQDSIDKGPNSATQLAPRMPTAA
jgi:DnaK suppressor protein